MAMKVLTGEIASQPTVVTLDCAGCIIVYVLIKIDGVYKKFYRTEGIRYKPDTGVSLPTSTFSNILVSSIGDNVCVQVSSSKMDDEVIFIYDFANETRGIGKIDK